MEERNENRREPGNTSSEVYRATREDISPAYQKVCGNPAPGVYRRASGRTDSKASGRASGLKWKIAVCILIVIVVLIVKKFDGQEKSRIISAVAEYYGRDYSVGDVVSAVSGGLEKAEELPSKIRDGVSGAEEETEKTETSDGDASAETGDSAAGRSETAEAETEAVTGGAEETASDGSSGQSAEEETL